MAPRPKPPNDHEGQRSYGGLTTDRPWTLRRQGSAAVRIMFVCPEHGAQSALAQACF